MFVYISLVSGLIGIRGMIFEKITYSQVPHYLELTLEVSKLSHRYETLINPKFVCFILAETVTTFLKNLNRYTSFCWFG
jgi:hypothetical protein